MEIRYCFANDLTLITKVCRQAGAAECAKQKALVVGFPPVTTESKFAINVGEVIAGGTANEEAETSSAVLSTSSDDKLWVCQFLDIIVSSLQFDSVVKSLDNLSATLLTEASFQHVLIDHVLCQVSFCFVRSYRYPPSVENNSGELQVSWDRSRSCVLRWTFKVPMWGWCSVMEYSDVIVCLRVELLYPLELCYCCGNLSVEPKKKEMEKGKESKKSKKSLFGWGRVIGMPNSFMWSFLFRVCFCIECLQML